MSLSLACARSPWRSGTPHLSITWCIPTCTPSSSRAHPESLWWRTSARSCLPSTATRITTPATPTRAPATATTEATAGAQRRRQLPQQQLAELACCCSRSNNSSWRMAQKAAS